MGPVRAIGTPYRLSLFLLMAPPRARWVLIVKADAGTSLVVPLIVPLLPRVEELPLLALRYRGVSAC